MLEVGLFSEFTRGVERLTMCVVRGSAQQPRLYIGMVLLLIMAEVLGLYGVIVAILMLTRSTMGVTECAY